MYLRYLCPYDPLNIDRNWTKGAKSCIYCKSPIKNLKMLIFPIILRLYPIFKFFFKKYLPSEPDEAILILTEICSIFRFCFQSCYAVLLKTTFWPKTPKKPFVPVLMAFFQFLAKKCFLKALRNNFESRFEKLSKFR